MRYRYAPTPRTVTPPGVASLAGTAACSSDDNATRVTATSPSPSAPAPRPPPPSPPIPSPRASRRRPGHLGQQRRRHPSRRLRSCRSSPPATSPMVQSFSFTFTGARHLRLSLLHSPHHGRDHHDHAVARRAGETLHWCRHVHGSPSSSHLERRHPPRQRPGRTLPHRAPARCRRHGHGLPRHRPQARP